MEGMAENVTQDALEKLPYGILVVGSLDGSAPVTMIATWATQVSFHPPLLAVAVEVESAMRRHIEQSGLFSINLLPEGGIQLAKRHLGRSEKRQLEEDLVLSRSGAPFLKEASGSLGCRLVSAYPAGDHIMFVGEVVEAAARNDGGILTLRQTGWKYRR